MKMKIYTYCNENTNERGQRLLEFMIINSLIATNTFGPHNNLGLTHGIVLEAYTIIK